MDQKTETGEKPEPRSRLIPCTRPDLAFTIGPQGEGQPQVKGKCGHTVWKREQIMLGDLVVSKADKDRFGFWGGVFGRILTDCFACIGKEELKHAIICAMCGDVIFRGQPVSLYGFTGDTSENPFYKHATWTFDRKATVNCMGWNCCPSGAFFSGHWHGDGVVTQFGTGTAVGDMFGGEISTGGGMIITI